MYRVGYIDDETTQYEYYDRKLKRLSPDMELVFLTDCQSQKDFLEKIYEEQIDVLLIDYRMAGNFGFNGTTLINYINDHVRDLECFILTGVDRELISDGLVTDRNTFQKTIFNTEADNPQKIQELLEFIDVLRNSAKVYRVRREQKIERYKELLELKKSGKLGADEEEFLSLYKVLSSYGMVEKLPKEMLSSSFEKDLDDLLRVGEAIVKKYTEE